MESPLLSIIIPAYNEENRLPNTLEQVCRFIQSQSYSTEVLIVENGSQDHTYEIAQTYADRNREFRALREERRGKGRAVQRGMLEARGDYRFMCDADLSMPINELNHFLPPQLINADVAIGSREAPGAVRYNEPIYRHLGGRMINTMIRMMALPGLQDTQCGFKCFRSEVAESIFTAQTLSGWSFDIELLFIARKRGYQITEVPINWYYDAESKINAVKAAWHMFHDILQIRKNDRQGLYN